MLMTIDEEEKHTITNSKGGGKKVFLTEDGLYEVLMQSRKPIAKAFKKEVKAILKQIRQTGGYIRYNKYRLLRRITYVRKYDREITSSISISIIYSWTNMLSNITKTSIIKERRDRTKEAR